jgi:hypothetical protein
MYEYVQICTNTDVQICTNTDVQTCTNTSVDAQDAWMMDTRISSLAAVQTNAATPSYPSIFYILEIKQKQEIETAIHLQISQIVSPACRVHSLLPVVATSSTRCWHHRHRYS